MLMAFWVLGIRDLRIGDSRGTKLKVLFTVSWRVISFNIYLYKSLPDKVKEEITSILTGLLTASYRQASVLEVIVTR